MRHNAQFYLRIVGREELAAIIRNKSLADFLSILITDRDVLQVRITGTEASGSRDCLVKGSMDAPGTWIDQ